MSMYNRIIDIQKLNAAWDKVRKNKPAKGVDGVTWDEFDKNRKANITEIFGELQNHTFSVTPVKKVTLYKGEKARDIMLYSMRDKVVQESIAEVLTKMYDNSFSHACFAYRPDKSALNAVASIAEAAADSKYSCFVKADIEHFFDHIKAGKLEGILRNRIQEDDVIDLIMSQATAPMLEEDGSIRPCTDGVRQGSAIAPVLSNIYMMDLDNDMTRAEGLYARYSDDVLMLAPDMDSAQQQLNRFITHIEALGLSINAKKTAIGNIADGFEFLGYHFDKSGKEIPSKAENSLTERLEGMWLTSKNMKITEKLEKASEIVNGWEQYFRGERKPSSMYEYATVLYMTYHRGYDGENDFVALRRDYHNENMELLKWMVSVWEQEKRPDMKLVEYEDFFETDREDTEAVPSSGFLADACEIYAHLVIAETTDDWENLMQLYSDEGFYSGASAISERIARLEQQAEDARTPEVTYRAETEKNGAPITLNGKNLEDYMQLFVGRDELYAEEVFQPGKGRKSDQVLEPLTAEVVKDHLKGTRTIDTVIVRNNSTVHYLVIDFDISKKHLLEDKPGAADANLESYLQKAMDLTQKYRRIISDLGLTAYPEDSGYRGFHLWVFFDEWIPIRYINMLTDVIENKAHDLRSDDISVEYFPNKTRIKPGKFGQMIKLPYGVHCKSGRRSVMLDKNFQPINAPAEFVDGVARFSLRNIKKILGSADFSVEENRQIDEDISSLGKVPESIALVLKNCALMRYLCMKAVKTGYLAHLERLSILYVFGHMGDDGKDFVHQVMKFTINYSYQTTQYFISRQKGKPISCSKLRDQYQRLTAEIGCSCNFSGAKNCYPSPVLHALQQLSADDSQGITMPTSRTMTKESSEAMFDQLNNNQKVSEIAKKILDLKKQKRGIDRNINKLEDDLGRIYDAANVETMECDMGILVRRKKADGNYEWVIEI